MKILLSILALCVNAIAASNAPIISVSPPITYTGGRIALPQATTGQSGYLSSTDFQTFNNKAPAITLGALDGRPANAVGLVYYNGVFYPQSASATAPGLVNLSAQTFQGLKTFQDGIAAPTITATTSLTVPTITATTSVTSPSLVATTGVTSPLFNTITSTELARLSGVGSSVRGISDVAVFTNKSIDADANTITNIENADIKSGAAIAVNKLAAVTSSRALVSDGSGVISPSATTATQIGYLSTTSSDVQTQINSVVASDALKAPIANPTFTGVAIFPVGSVANPSIGFTGFTTTGISYNAGAVRFSIGGTEVFQYYNGGIVSQQPVVATAVRVSGQTASRVPYLDSNKDIVSSSVTPTELGYVSGVTSAIQTQINTKAPSDSPTLTGGISLPGITASRVLINNGSNQMVAGNATSTELGYLSGVTSAIQTQLNLLAPKASPTFTGTVTTPVTASRALVTGASSDLVASATTATQIGYLSTLSSDVQTQINTKSPIASPTFTGTVTAPSLTTTTNTILRNGAPGVVYFDYYGDGAVRAQIDLSGSGGSAGSPSLAKFAPVMSAGVTRTYTFPDASGTVPLLNGNNTWTGNQTISTAGGPMLTLQDGGTAGVNADSSIVLRDSSSDMMAIGFTNGASLNAYLWNYKNGNLILGTNSATALTLSPTLATFANGIVAANGTTSVPSISFASDTTTGLFRRGSASLGVVAAGTEVASFQSGLTNLRGATAAPIYIKVALSDSNGLQIFYGTGGAYIRNGYNEDLYLGTNNTDKFIIGAGGTLSAGDTLRTDTSFSLRAATSTGVSQYGLYVWPTSSTAATTEIFGISASPRQSDSITTARRIGFYGDNPPKGTGSTITRDILYGGIMPTRGTNNAFLADNSGFTGNYFINQAGTDLSSLSGPLYVDTAPAGNASLYVRNGGATNAIPAFYVDNTSNNNYGALIFQRANMGGSKNAFIISSGAASQTGGGSASMLAISLPGASSTIPTIRIDNEGSGDFFIAKDWTGTTKFRVDSSGNLFGSSIAAANTDWIRGENTGTIRISGSNGVASGGAIYLYGSAHATNAGQIILAQGGNLKLSIDSGGSINLNAATTLLTGAFTIPDGTAGAPSIKFSGTTTGFYHTGNAMRWVHSGDEKAQTWSGGTYFTKAIAFNKTDVASTGTPITAMASGTTNIRLTGSTATDIQGITAGAADGQLLIIFSPGAAFTLRHENASASAANRINTPTGADMGPTSGLGLATLMYDASNARWLVMDLQL